MNGGKQIKTWTGHGGGVLDVAFTGDGRLVTCGRDKQAKIWDGAGAQKAIATGFADFPVTACLTSDGAKFVVADWTGAVKNGIPQVQAALAAAQKTATDAKPALAARQQEEASAKAAGAPAKAKVDAANATLAKFDAELETIKARYLTALPKPAAPPVQKK